MLRVWNDVGKRLQKKLKLETNAPYPKLYLTTSDISKAPPTFPCLFINSLGEPTAGSDFQNNQCYITSTIELQSYSAESYSGSQVEAQKIMDAAGDVMLSMGYQLIAGPYQSNNGYFRTIARFRRLVGSGDKL